MADRLVGETVELCSYSGMKGKETHHDKHGSNAEGIGWKIGEYLWGQDPQGRLPGDQDADSYESDYAHAHRDGHF